MRASTARLLLLERPQVALEVVAVRARVAEHGLLLVAHGGEVVAAVHELALDGGDLARRRSTAAVTRRWRSSSRSSSASASTDSALAVRTRSMIRPSWSPTR